MYNLIPCSFGKGSIFRYMDEVERSLFGGGAPRAQQFRCDISEHDGQYALAAELPGFDKKDISVEVEGETLTITAKREDTHSETDKDGGYLRRERRFGSFSRRFSIDGVDASRITADYRDGVLHLSLPKPENDAQSVKRIEIGG